MKLIRWTQLRKNPRLRALKGSAIMEQVAPVLRMEFQTGRKRLAKWALSNSFSSCCVALPNWSTVSFLHLLLRHTYMNLVITSSVEYEFVTGILKMQTHGGKTEQERCFFQSFFDNLFLQLSQGIRFTVNNIYHILPHTLLIQISDYMRLSKHLLLVLRNY